MKRKPQNSAAFFENNSWYHRTKILQDDGSIKYSKKGGFATSEEADKSYRRHEDEFKRRIGPIIWHIKSIQKSRLRII